MLEENDKINVNCIVKVRLTAKGRAIMKKNHDAIYVGYPPSMKREFVPPVEDENGYIEIQLWCLMNEFGQHMKNGFDNCFDTTILYSREL